MFLKVNNTVVNLDNVSNINLIKHRNRIAFNMNYNIELRIDEKTKYISDYVYWDAKDDREYEDNLRRLQTDDFFICEFIKHPNGFININEISSIKYNEFKRRVIFNLSHTVSFKDESGDFKLTSEFVYVNFNSQKEYDEFVNYLENELGYEYKIHYN